MLAVSETTCDSESYQRRTLCRIKIQRPVKDEGNGVMLARETTCKYHSKIEKPMYQVRRYVIRLKAVFFLNN